MSSSRSLPTATTRGDAWVLRLLVIGVVVSVVHYVDNVVNYADYPQADGGLAPSRAVIAVSWFVFTALAYASWQLLRRGRRRAAAAALLAYSLSGLVGLGHYTVEGASGMPWWRHAHVVADIVCGIAIAAAALWMVGSSAPDPQAAGASTR